MGSEVMEAVNAATAATSTAIIQRIIDTNVLEYQVREAPLLAAIPTKKIAQATYLFAQRTKRPAGGAVVDGGARPNSNSVWAQFQFDIKNYQVQSSITGFAQEVTAGVVGDLAQAELDGAMQSQLWALETSVMYANSAATKGITATYGPDMDGLDTQVSQYVASANAPKNVIDAAGGNLAFTGSGGVNALMSLVSRNAGRPLGSGYMFIVSPDGESMFAELLQNQQRFMGEVEIAAGLVVQSYRNVPIIRSSFLGSVGQTFGTVTSATATTGGTLAAATYFYKVQAVINRFGQLGASNEVSQTTTGSTSTVTLSFSSPTDSEGNEPILFKVFRATSTGAEVLIGVVPSVDPTGAAVTSIVDTGTNLIANGTSIGGTNYPTAYVGAAGALGNEKPRASTADDVFLVPRDPNLLLRPYVRDFRTIQLAPTTASPDALPFAILNDTCLAVRGPKFVGRLTNLAIAL